MLKKKFWSVSNRFSVKLVQSVGGILGIADYRSSLDNINIFFFRPIRVHPDPEIRILIWANREESGFLDPDEPGWV